METLAVDRDAETLVLVPTGLESPRHDSTVAAFAAVNNAAQLIERSEAHITVAVPKRRPLSILERFVLRAISLQAEARGKAVWMR